MKHILLKFRVINSKKEQRQHKIFRIISKKFIGIVHCFLSRMLFQHRKGKMNLKFTKLISSATTVLAMGASAYADTNCCPPPKCCPVACDQGYELNEKCFPAAYNAAARFDVQNCWDFFVSGSFIYWNASQDGMDLAHQVVAGTMASTGGSVLVQKSEYKPGFKVAIGMDFDYDNWVGAVEYTWFRSKTHKSGESLGAGTSWMLHAWFPPHALASEVSSEWKLNMDILDATLSRPFYQGRMLTITPYTGLRAAWIRQNLEVEGFELASHNHSQSWSIGPVAGMQSRWLLGSGFRIEGDVGGNILYTRYTKVSNRVDGVISHPLDQHDRSTLRPGASMGLGLGWGSYLDCQNYHLDILASYDFNVFSGQNVMRDLVDGVGEGDTAATGGLYLHGLTATVRFDF